MNKSAPDDTHPSLANAQVTGGGGHEPDLTQDTAAEGRARVPAAGSGVDMKADSLPDPEGE